MKNTDDVSNRKPSELAAALAIGKAIRSVRRIEDAERTSARDLGDLKNAHEHLRPEMHPA